MKKILFVILVLVMLTAVFSGTTMAASSNVGEELRVAVMSFYCSSVMGYIVDQGWDKQEGLNLKTIMFSSGAPINEAMAAGEWDVAVTGGAFIFAMAQLNGKLIGHQIDGTYGQAVFVRKDSPILSVKGVNPKLPEVYGDPKTVSEKMLLQTTGTTSQYVASSWLEAIGLKEDQVNAVSLSFAQAYQSFLIGEGDITSLCSPFVVKAYQTTDWVEVANLKKLDKKLYESIICTEDAYKNRREDVVKLLRLIYRANDVLEANPDLKFEVAAKWYKESGKELTESEVKAECEGKPFVTSAEAKKIVLGKFAKEYAEFFASVNKFDQVQVKAVEGNVYNDIFQEALDGIK